MTFSAEFLEVLRSVRPSSGWKILVVDSHSQALLGAVLKQFDILAEHVTCALWNHHVAAHRR